MKTIIYWIVSFISLKVIDFFVPQVQVSGFLAVGIFLLIFSIVNNFIKPILQILTFPISILTLGLFSVLINFFCLWLAMDLTNVIQIQASGVVWWFWAFIISCILSISGQVYDEERD